MSFNVVITCNVLIFSIYKLTNSKLNVYLNYLILIAILRGLKIKLCAEMPSKSLNTQIINGFAPKKKTQIINGLFSIQSNNIFTLEISKFINHMKYIFKNLIDVNQYFFKVVFYQRKWYWNLIITKPTKTNTVKLKNKTFYIDTNTVTLWVYSSIYKNQKWISTYTSQCTRKMIWLYCYFYTSLNFQWSLYSVEKKKKQKLIRSLVVCKKTFLRPGTRDLRSVRYKCDELSYHQPATLYSTL